MKKTIMGLFAAAAIMGGAATMAEAKTSFSVHFGVPYFSTQIGPGYRYYPNRGWHDRRWHNGSIVTFGAFGGGFDRLSCNQARRIVRNEGFRRVVARDCQGTTYSFSTRRNASSNRVIVYVNARTGNTWIN